PALRTNQVVAIAGPGVILGANIAPLVVTYPEQPFSGSSQTVVPLYASDLNLDSLIYRITRLPERGRLYQFTENGPGEALAAGAVVTDPGQSNSDLLNRARVIFIAD